MIGDDDSKYEDERRVISVIKDTAAGMIYDVSGGLADGRGLGHYGWLNVETDKRDFALEARDKLRDAAIYLAAGIVQCEKQHSAWMRVAVLRSALRGVAATWALLLPREGVRSQNRE
jgi:hypothetical protein